MRKLGIQRYQFGNKVIKYGKVRRVRQNTDDKELSRLHVRKYSI